MLGQGHEDINELVGAKSSNSAEVIVGEPTPPTTFLVVAQARGTRRILLTAATGVSIYM